MYNTLNNPRGASTSKKNSKSFRYTDHSGGSMTLKDDKEKEYINYRVKQNNRKPPLSSKERTSLSLKQKELGEKFKTEEILDPKT